MIDGHGLDYAAGSAVLTVFLAAMWVFTVGLAPAALLLASGRSRQVALASVAGFVVGVVLMAVLAPTWGVAGGSTGFLVGSAVNLVVVVVLGLRTARKSVMKDVSHDRSSESRRADGPLPFPATAVISMWGKVGSAVNLVAVVVLGLRHPRGTPPR